jgi:hypothetical protein
MAQMVDAPASEIQFAVPKTATGFPAMYYDSPITQFVLGVDVRADDSLTAAITAGAPYFKISAIDVCNWVKQIEVVPPALTGELPTNPRMAPSTPGRVPTPGGLAGPIRIPTTMILSAPVATSDGVKPLVVKQNQYVRVWVTADVPKGAALPAGNFTGAVKLTGASLTQIATLEGSYLGTLIGQVIVQPETAVPGQPVLVQVCDATGKQVSDPTVTVIIHGVPATARYYQFPTVGSYKLVVRAVRGTLSETTLTTVSIAGKALAFRKSLALPAVTEIPMLQVGAVPGQPYAATFTLGNTASTRRLLAEAVAKAATTHPAPKVIAAVTPVAASLSPTDSLGAEFTKLLPTLPAAKVTRIPPSVTKTATGTATSSAVLAAAGGLLAQLTATSYQWDFGDGQTLTTQSPNVTHDYFAAIQAEDVTRSFHVTCKVVHDNITVTRTLVVHAAYGLCRRQGIIVPPVTGTVYATFQQVAFSASLIVHNLEGSAIALDSMACVPLSDDTTVALPAPQFTAMQVPVVVAAKSASALGIYIPLSQLQLDGAVVNGFTVYYSGGMNGTDGTTVPVRLSYTFRIPLSDSGMPGITVPSQWAATNWDVGAALQAVTGVVTQPVGAVSKPGSQVMDPATKTVAVALSASPTDLTTQVQIRSAFQAGLTGIALKAGALTATGANVRLAAPALSARKSPAAPRDIMFDPLSPPAVAAGNQCYPDDISDAAAATAAAQQLVCQATSQTKTETLPSSLQNAQAGDIILCPAPVGTGDLIAAMFRALSPPQHHGHSGIMTANFYEITHCTASIGRISANLNKDAVGIPTSLNGNMLQYGWPGSLTQSISDATSSLNFKDPSGASYSMKSFDTDSSGDGFEIIPQLIVKPLPENEATARPVLRKAADTARSKGAQYDSGGNLVSKGGCYYSFYAYTDPQLSAGFTDGAGADAGWAQGMSPAVCSSFVWLCLKENNIPLVTSNKLEALSDFSAIAVSAGAQVGAATLDGLIYYPQAERQQAAQALYQMFMTQALSQEYGLGTLPGVNEAIAGQIADQLLNAFASGNPNLVGSSAWQNPGDGNAVSPDNIILWNPPYYGYAEPAQYLPQHTETYTVCEWTKVITWGSIKGTVRLNGAPVPNAHVWVYLPGGDAYTAADGTYTLNHVPIGLYQLKAQAVVTTNGVSGEYSNGQDGQSITLTAAAPNIVGDITLQGLAQNYRRLDMSYSISCDHQDNNPWNTHGVQNAGPYSHSLYVNPGQWTDSATYTYDYNGGGYFHIDYAITIALVGDLSIEVTIVAVMYDDGSNSVQDQYSVGPFNVPMGETWSGTMTMEHSNGYHNGPAIFTFSVTNNQQTG